MRTVRVGIVGGTGYTGVELLRLLASHPGAEVVAVTSRAEAGVRLDVAYPSLQGFYDLAFAEPTVDILRECEVVFFATPNGTAMRMTRELLGSDVKIIDLAADFRFPDAGTWEQWYGEPHACPELLAEAVYGLPEVNRERIQAARLIGCPGCYPTAVQLAFLPLLEASWVEPGHLIADVKSGVSGAGRKAELNLLMSEAGESFKAYGVAGHRHQPEIRAQLESRIGESIGLVFVPHLTPMIRGIHATCYGVATKNSGDLQSLFENRYRNEPFVTVLPAGSHPDTRNVRGSNRCQLSVHRPKGGNTIVVLSVIDNLVKGAAGQAVQNFNLLCGFPETQALEAIALYP